MNAILMSIYFYFCQRMDEASFTELLHLMARHSRDSRPWEAIARDLSKFSAETGGAKTKYTGRQFLSVKRQIFNWLDRIRF
jgi:hypothetical protein